VSKLQQSVSTPRRRTAARRATGPRAPPTPKRRISTAAKIFYLMRWTYHFITPIGMVIIIWGVIEAATGDPSVGWPIIAGGAAFTYLANYFNKAR
jgi:hypothetical protein